MIEQGKPKYGEIDEETGDVICLVCKERMETISYRHLFFKHGINNAQYKEKFPGVIVSSEAYRRKISERKKEAARLRKLAETEILPTGDEEPKQELPDDHIDEISDYDNRKQEKTPTVDEEINDNDVNEIDYAELAKRSRELNELSSKNDEVIDLIDVVESPNDEQPQVQDDKAFDKILEKKGPSDPAQEYKLQILDVLRGFFGHVQPDYMIESYGPMSGRLKFRFVTDFADPVMKVVIMFPNTFWHNRDFPEDPQKNEKLRDDNWKVITIKEPNPTLVSIQKVIGAI